MTKWRNSTNYGKRIGLVGGFMGNELLLFTVIIATVISAIMTFIFSK